MRALLVVLDSFGVGSAPDAESREDSGADTLGRIFAKVPGVRIPTLIGLGLGEILARASGAPAKGRTPVLYGRMRKASAGEDTTTGHWEMAGVLLDEPFATFERFPESLISSIGEEAGIEFVGNIQRSGSAIIQELGPVHVRTGNPILYTSADSVMQIAAHEHVVPVPRLYEICRVARRHCDEYRIGRVIARPFVGDSGAYRFTAGRHDFSMVPPRTVLNMIAEAGHVVYGVGKIGDIFAGSGITHSQPTDSNAEGMRAIEAVWSTMGDGLIFANLADFDTLYAHRRDLDGYAGALEEFDRWLHEFLPKVFSDDLLILTAVHGNDPGSSITDHTCEEVPLIVKFNDLAGAVGTRASFADVAATLASYFDLQEPMRAGTSVIPLSGGDAHSVAD